jgi:hypothetical protein
VKDSNVLLGVLALVCALVAGVMGIMGKSIPVVLLAVATIVLAIYVLDWI